jgi:hypothetical protein
MRRAARVQKERSGFPSGGGGPLLSLSSVVNEGKVSASVDPTVTPPTIPFR